MNAEDQSSNSVAITKFEQLSNELISMCFNYFHFHELYETFFSLNQRFNQLLFQQINISIDLDSVPNDNLLTFCFQLHDFLSKSQNHSLAIRTSDEQRLNLIINDRLFHEKVTKLKSLKLFNLHTYPVPNIRFNERMTLYQSLERLTLHEISEGEEHGTFLKELCNELISSKLPSLKYLSISFSPYRCGCSAGDHHAAQNVEFEFDDLPDEEEKPISNLETLIIGNTLEMNYRWTSTQVSFHVLTKKLLPRLPRLSKLMINAVHFDQNRNLQLMGMHQPTADNDAEIPLNLKIIKIWTNTNGRYEHGEKRNHTLLKKFFLNSNSSHTTIQAFCINNENVLP